MRVVRIASVMVAVLCAIIVVLDYFISEPRLDAMGAALYQWVTLLAAVALVLGLLNLARVHGGRIVAGRPGWPYSLALLGGLIVTLLLGFAPGSGGGNDPSLNWIFSYVYQPLAAVFSLLAFYIASAAYRALRLRTLESAALLIAATIVLLGQIPLGGQLWDALPLARTWMLAVVGTAGMRGIVIGAALGAMLTGLRVLLGADRPYLDQDQ